MSSDIAYTSR